MPPDLPEASKPPTACEICDATGRTLNEAFTIPSDLSVLMPLLATTTSEGWPGVWTCEECRPIAAAVFREFYELPVEELVGVTSGIVRAACRAVLSGPDPEARVQTIDFGER